MKNIVTLILGICLSFSLSAQLVDGSVAPNFTATDLNGNTWTLYDVLDQGKSVIIDFSATWCGPCWAYHNTNALQQFYEAHGPNGDNTSMVLFIEGDVTTSVDCITNGAVCQGGTQGNWTTGKTYPFIDDASGDIMTDYAISYYPTIYLICSDKLTKEVGQLQLPPLEAEAGLCPVITSTSKLLTGSVVHDINTNCVPESGETALPSWGVTVVGQSGVPKSTVSNSNGIYKMYIDSLDSPFSIAFTSPNNLWSPCPPPAPFTPPATDTMFLDHPAQVLIACPQLNTQIGTPLLRRCFTNNFNVSVCNNGSALAENAFVDVVLPSPDFEPITAASLPYVAISNGIYRFQLGNLEIGDCSNFTFSAVVSCDSTIIGQTLCFEAHAYPDSLCTPVTANWNGANVSVTATCENGAPQFTIANTGTAPMSEASNFVLIENSSIQSQGTFLLNAGEAQTLNATGNGSTWRIEATQVPNHPNSSNPSVGLEGCTNGTNFTTGFLLGYSVFDPSAAHDVECMVIIGSWDPNDKTGFPLGLTNQHLISKNTDIDYLIRFQNTGNDTAFNFVVRDTLSARLDVKTIELGAASHAYEYTVENDNILIFNFKDIKLVDSFANESASHGYLRFKISQKPNLADGSVINNRAAIYFDFNEPVITNTTLHRVGDVPQVSAIKNIFKESVEVAVYPNPLGNSAVLQTKTEMPAGAKWALYDLNGKLLAGGNMSGNSLNIGSYLKNSGLYHVRFISKNGEELGGASFFK